MQQLRLLDTSGYIDTRSVSFRHIKATFMNVVDALYDVVLEINSHKFMIRLKAGIKKLEAFEIIAVKGSIELCVRSLYLLRRIVTNLYFEN